jgi:predicted ATPase
MITLIEALNFRCLRYIQQPLGPFHVLVGPNASGKTTFLDVVSFLGQLVSEGLDAAINERTQNFKDLLWKRDGKGFELAIEAKIPEERRQRLGDKQYEYIRYEVSLEYDHSTNEVLIVAERVLLKTITHHKVKAQRIFPFLKTPPESIITRPRSKGVRPVVTKVQGSNDNFYSEAYRESGKGWFPAFKFGPRKSALSNLPEDETQFPATTWLKNLLIEGVQQFVLNSMLIRKSSPSGKVRKFKPDGSNLPWVIQNLETKNPKKFQNWVAHLKTALPDIENIRTIERPDDKQRYLLVCYKHGLEVPSWMVSDGTLRLLALTLPAYLSDFSGVYLIEEPENGIHPRAVETMFQSLSSVYDAQILLATHSSVILSLVDASKVLCFAKTAEGATDIVLGSEHPALKEWRCEENLGVLFAGGVLG